MLSRVFLVKSDKVTITVWKLDLYRILHVFNVRPVAPVWSRLTVRFQTELAVDTNTVVSKICHDTMKTDTCAVKPGVGTDTYAVKTDTHAVKTDSNAAKTDSNAVKTDSDAVQIDTNAMRINTAKTDAAVPGTRHTVVRRQKGADSKKRQVSVICTLLIAEPTLTTP